MSPAAIRTRTRRNKKKEAPFWLQFWPLVLGVIATPFAVRGASVLALTGPTALRLLYPYVVLIQSNAQRFSPEQVDTLSQWTLYGQFPLYGVLWIVARRFLGGSAGLLAVLIVHAAGVGLAILAAGG